METSLDWYQEHSVDDASAKRSLKFFIGSSFLHVVMLALALVVSVLMPKPELPTTTEITILDSSPSMPLAVAPMIAAKTMMPTPPKGETAKSAAPELSQPVAQEAKSEAPMVDKDTVVVPPTKMARSKQIAAQKMMPAKSVPAAAPAPTHFQGPTVADSDVDTALQSEDLENMLHEDVAVAPAKQLNEKDISDDLDKVDNEQSAKMAALKQDMDKQSNGVMAEQEEDLKAMKADTDEQAKALAQQAAAIKAADHARIQKAVASEQKAAALAAANARAAEEKAAQEREAAERNAAQKAAAAQFAAAQKEAAAKAAAAQYADEMARGNALGMNEPVKSLGDIRQYPNNKKPEYENEDRMAGRQGDVAFLAYVSPEGKISQLKLLKSSGHRSLDGKTLAAIRSWKFYPGQAGWVEIPFKWDLKGGPQEMATTLRRSVSQK